MQKEVQSSSTSKKGFIIAVLAILALAVFSSFYGSSVTGQQVAFSPKCDYLSYPFITPNFLDGNSYCKAIGYKYAAFVDLGTVETYYTSEDLSCSGGIQVSQINYRSIGGTENVNLSVGMGCRPAPTGSAEPMRGDAVIDIRETGVLCCK